RPARVLALPAVVAALAFLAPTDALSQKGKKAPPGGKAADLLKPKPRPKRPDLPPSKLPLEFIKGERIALVGNSLAERMNLYGHFETLLHLRFPEKELVIRNFARPAEEVSVHQRSGDYTKIDDPLAAFGPDTFLCFFGFNESFQASGGREAAVAAVDKFKAEYEKFIDEYSRRYPRDDSGAKPRFVLISPITFENTGDPLLPDAKAMNVQIKPFADAVKAVAEKRAISFVDLFNPTQNTFTDKGPGLCYTN